MSETELEAEGTELDSSSSEGSEEGNEEGYEETGDDSGESELTVDDYKKLETELMQARKKIAVLSKEKKTNKETKPLTKPEDFDLDAALDRRDFYKSNSDASEYKDEIEELYAASKGKFSRQELFSKLSGDSEIEENRKVYGKSAVSGKQSQNDSFAKVTVGAFDKMTSAQQKAYVESSTAKLGGVAFKE